MAPTARDIGLRTLGYGIRYFAVHISHLTSHIRSRLPAVGFSARLYFDFVTPDVFRFYRVLVGAQEEGVTLRMEWRPYPGSGSAPDQALLAAAELVRLEVPDLHLGFVRAVLAAVHLEGDAVDDPSLAQVAARAAGVGIGVVAPDRIAERGQLLLAEAVSEAVELGVEGVPSLYRQGSPLRIETTEAISSGSSRQRLELIDGMLEDDGLWLLAKP